MEARRRRQREIHQQVHRARAEGLAAGQAESAREVLAVARVLATGIAVILACLVGGLAIWRTIMDDDH